MSSSSWRFVFYYMVVKTVYRVFTFAAFACIYRSIYVYRFVTSLSILFELLFISKDTKEKWSEVKEVGKVEEDPTLINVKKIYWKVWILIIMKKKGGGNMKKTSVI